MRSLSAFSSIPPPAVTIARRLLTEQEPQQPAHQVKQVAAERAEEGKDALDAGDDEVEDGGEDVHDGAQDGAE